MGFRARWIPSQIYPITVNLLKWNAARCLNSVCYCYVCHSGIGPTLDPSGAFHNVKCVIFMIFLYLRPRVGTRAGHSMLSYISKSTAYITSIE